MRIQGRAGPFAKTAERLRKAPQWPLSRDMPRSRTHGLTWQGQDTVLLVDLLLAAAMLLQCH